MVWEWSEEFRGNAKAIFFADQSVQIEWSVPAVGIRLFFGQLISEKHLKHLSLFFAFRVCWSSTTTTVNKEWKMNLIYGRFPPFLLQNFFLLHRHSTDPIVHWKTHTFVFLFFFFAQLCIFSVRKNWAQTHKEVMGMHKHGLMNEWADNCRLPFSLPIVFSSIVYLVRLFLHFSLDLHAKAIDDRRRIKPLAR